MEKKSTFRSRIRQITIPSVLLNKYVFTIFVFGVWMTFFDQNNFLHQYHRLRDLKEAKSKTDYYVSETNKTEKQLHDLMYNQDALERFAREKYLMKKPDEDVFVIVE